MPIYEYRCAKGHTFEVMQRISEDPVEKCEVCGRPVARVLHPVAVHFKGSGFYNTDYGTRKRQRESASSEKSTSEKDTAKSSSDSKKDAKTSSDSAAKPAASADAPKKAVSA